ncbi:MAG: GNAT family N-acetyltransferase [Waddliaceae bacterium]
MSASNDVSITQICFQDIDGLVENFCFPWDTPEKTQEKWKQYFEEHQKKIRTVAVAKLYDEIVGYGSLLYTSEYPLFADVPEISDVWIHEKHRGMGLGTAVIQWFEALAKERGYKEVGIGVGLYTDYGAAQKLYVKLGYVPDGNGITYQCKKTNPGTPYPLDDDLILWLKKPLR